MKNVDESLNKEMLLELSKLLAGKDISKINQSLRRVFFDYMRYQKEGLPTEFDEILNDVETLHEVIHILTVRDARLNN
jgi:hypothetical protein